MKIVLTLNNYKYLTGSELYVHTLASELLKMNHEVTILANQIGGEIAVKTPVKTPEKIEIYPFFDHPDIEPDLVISSQPQPTSYALKAFLKAFHVQVLHSIFGFEEPVIDDKLMKYIAVRPEIKKHWSDIYPQIDTKTAVIWNGIDTARFNTNYEDIENKKFTILFVGTFDQLRRDVLMDLVKQTYEDEQILQIVMPENPFTKENQPPHVEYYPSMWHVEELVKRCDKTAGIFIGRTTIEGFLCGKPALVYDVNEDGKILQKATYGVPQNLEIFNSEYMAKCILKEYELV